MQVCLLGRDRLCVAEEVKEVGWSLAIPRECPIYSQGRLEIVDRVMVWVGNCGLSRGSLAEGVLLVVEIKGWILDIALLASKVLLEAGDLLMIVI